MKDWLAPYHYLREWRDRNIVTHRFSTDELHDFHEVVMKKVFEITLEETIKKYGSPPCRFSWFVMGSAGRCEQAVISDQDHGIIYEHTDRDISNYFRTFGSHLSTGLHYIGYPYCDGNIMSSTQKWCQSDVEWEAQIKKWIEEETWESIRYLLVFSDARVIAGEEMNVQQLKELIVQSIRNNPHFLNRLLENTMHSCKAIGFFNQLLTVPSGPYAGCINLKRTAFFPYVNAIRLLAIKENIEETSTLLRMEALFRLEKYNKEYNNTYQVNFQKLLQYRLRNENIKNYEAVHYLDVKQLNRLEKLEMKQILKDGEKLQNNIKAIVKRTIKNGD